MSRVKIIANYLPQFHTIQENDLWWGEGYTDWIGVRSAKPQFDGHHQPKTPLNNHYYDLSDVSEIEWQTKLARKYGIWGFGIYHYWFSSELTLLEKPGELILQNPSIDINFLFIWDNCSWKRTWSNIKGNDWAPAFDQGEPAAGQNLGMLAELRYGDKNDWEKHFYYLLPFFRDSRYITIGGKPAFCFMNPRNDGETIRNMCECWDSLAKKNGLNGVCCLMLDNYFNRVSGITKGPRFRYTPMQSQNAVDWMVSKTKTKVARLRKQLDYRDYDNEWKKILKAANKADKDTFLSGFVSFDDTPRRGNQARIIQGASPRKFELYLKQLIHASMSQGKEHVFLSAWNEWGEGMYLEPDEENGYAYLDAVRRVVMDGLGDGSE